MACWPYASGDTRSSFNFKMIRLNRHFAPIFSIFFVLAAVVLLDRYFSTKRQGDLLKTLSSLPPQQKQELPETVFLTGSRFLDLTLVGRDGQLHRLPPRRRTLAFLFTTKCPYCVQTSKDLDKVYRTFDRRSVDIIGLALDTRDHRDLDKFKSEQGLLLPLYTLSSNESLQISTVPQTVLISPQGFVERAWVGSLSENDNQILQRMLKPPRKMETSRWNQPAAPSKLNLQLPKPPTAVGSWVLYDIPFVGFLQQRWVVIRIAGNSVVCNIEILLNGTVQSTLEKSFEVIVPTLFDKEDLIKAGSKWLRCYRYSERGKTKWYSPEIPIRGLARMEEDGVTGLEVVNYSGCSTCSKSGGR